MKNHTSIHTLLRVALVLGAASLTACPGPEEEDTGGSSDGDTTAGTDTTVNPVTETTNTTPPGTESSSSSSDDGVDSTSETGDDPFVFPTDPYSAYTQIDRHGAVEAGTAGIAAPEGLGFEPGSDISVRDEYNASNPQEDDDGVWLAEIAASITFFHDALDDDIEGLMLTPATIDQTVMQAGPVIIPDTIKYDPSMPTGYPNGRALTDPVVDITLAAVMLDLNEHPLTLFADLPLNPPENDVPFESDFPYLAPPHPPKK
jgi:hypothetical protein